MPVERVAIGWREWVSLPDLGIAAMRAKIDSGARTAALHAFDLEIVDGEATQVARFLVHAAGTAPVEAAEVEIIGWRKVRNPGGRRETRPVISTRIGLGQLFRAEITLTQRDEMGFRLLLGRQTLRRRFLIDPGRSYVLGEQPPGVKNNTGE